MRRIISIIVIALLMASPLFSKVTAPSQSGRAGGGSSSYAALWKQVEQFENDGKPKSAYEALQKILNKAEGEGHQGQALSARLRAAALHQEWVPDSFFTDVAELEVLRSRESRPEAKAIYASILAEIYENNSSRSQARALQLTSEEMKEWTQEQYDSAATENWRRSLADIQALSAAKSKDWLPFVKQETHSKYFNHDLLHILWQRVRKRNQGMWKPSPASELANAVKAEYVRLGNREAQLLLDLDLIDVARVDPLGITPVPGRDITKELLHLTEVYADLPLCTEVYLKLLDRFDNDITREQRVAWAEEAIRRYPRYDRLGEVRNFLNELRHPYVNWQGNEIYYPGKDYTWKISNVNATGVTLAVYRLKDTFKEEDVHRSKLSVNDFFRNNATLVQTLRPTIQHGAPYETIEDSIIWTAPGPGRYAILYSGTTDEKEATKKTVTNQYRLFRVTALKTIYRFHDAKTLEVIVVDAESGLPVEGASVAIYSSNYRSGKRTQEGNLKTDAEGRALFQYQNSKDNRPQFIIAASTATDHYLPEESLWGRNSFYADGQTSTNLRLYTDRAIYRPGQTVYLSGIAYSQANWDAHALAGKTYKLILRNANWKEVATSSAATDSLGVLAADFVLPKGSLPGIYRIQTDGADVSFRVEEYKRPTFEVKMDEAPAMQWPQDSIELTGRAIAYTGVPIREARVTGTYQFTYPYFWWFSHDDSPEMPIDTVQTDGQGIFRVRVPLKDIPAEALRHGLVLRLNAEVLSVAGETREGCLRVPLCTTPLRLNITMDEKQDRDRLKAPAFSLLSSTGKAVEGDIRCDIYPATATVSSPDEKSFMATNALVTGIAPSAILDALRGLPSGDYELRANAQAGNDTASACARFYLFSMTDSRLPRSAESWLYCQVDTFDALHPARIQVGSSFEDVALYYSLVSKDGIVKDQLIPLSDELRTIEIPYLPEYGDGVTAHLAFVKHGTCYIMNQSLKLAMPSKELHWQWTTFRDRLHPGDRETWTLRLTDPDGKPASANLMATIYDASLDQLTPHSWDLLVSRMHRLRFLPWRSQDFFANGNSSHQLYFAMKDYRSPGLSFDSFDEQWTYGLAFNHGGFGLRRMMKASRAGGVMATEESVVMNDMVAEIGAPAEAPMMMAASAQMATKDTEEYEDKGGVDDGDVPTISPAIAALRTNFNETAAFFPRLHSDPATGEVTLSFTLPESLTTWQLLGVAHTSDLLTANIQAQTIAQKEMMAQLYLPRFLRVGDNAGLRATIQNLTDDPIEGLALLEVFDPETEKVILKRKIPFKADAKGECLLTFDYMPTDDYPVVAVRLTASSRSFTDGEQRYLPILPNKTYVTESVEIRADSLGTFTTDLSSLFNHNSPTATNRRLTVEYTAHPIWYALQALPSLIEPQHDDIISLATSLQAQSLATYIANNTPRLQSLVDIWQREAAQGQPSLASKLAEDEELKQIILDETPWLREAESEADRKARLIELFDISRQEATLVSLAQRVEKRLEPDGGYAWFPGMKSSEVMTRMVASEFTRLRTMTNDFHTLPAEVKSTLTRLLAKNVAFVASKMAQHIAELKKAEAKGVKVSTASLAYLSYVYTTQHAGVNLTSAQKKDVTYLLDHMKGSVASMDNWERAMAAVVMKGAGRQAEARQYYESLLEHTTTTADHGTFFDYAGGSFEPTSHKIIHHVAAMEAVNVMEPQNKVLQRGLRRWLLQQKRTQMWESNICTADAIYALVTGNTSELSASEPDDIKLNYARRHVDITRKSADKAVAGLGFIKQQFADGEAPKTVTVTRHTDSEAWGAVVATFLTPMTDASASATGLKVRREVNAANLKVGDRLTSRYVITADRDYEYVCLRVSRAACAEPASQMSGYRYQGGLGYYRAVRDAHTDYFFDRLPKGTYVLEEEAFIDRDGTYTTGLVTLRCLYAPEYGSNTPALQLNVEK